MSRRPGSAGRPPAIVIGGEANALSVTRVLAREGVEVHVLNYPGMAIGRSRYGRTLQVPAPGGPPQWEQVLLSEATISKLGGAVLLTCSDEAIELMIRCGAQLAQHYRVEAGTAEGRLKLLDKQRTYEAARAAGVPYPRFLEPGSNVDVALIERELSYPIIIKPNIRARFQQTYGAKFLRAESRAELVAKLTDVQAKNFNVVLMEFIPGPDDRLCSYYTYMDDDNQPLLDFTKRVWRRLPVNMGGATYHVTDWVPEARRLGLKFFQHVGLRGLGNVEFKLDHRDGQLKIIESNARFTAANALVEASGMPLAWFVYCRLVGDPIPAPTRFESDVRMLEGIRDYLAFRQLAQNNDLAFGAWLRSVTRARVFPYFDARDPLPWLHRGATELTQLLKRGLRRLRR